MEEVPLVLNLIDKSVRQFSLYGPGHPQSAISLRDFHVRLSEFLDRVGQLDLTVKRTEVEWNGTPVFKLEKRENNYLQQMYMDGIRQVTFLKGVSTDELKDFVWVLSRDANLYETREDDTVTLFWKKGFSHLFFQTVDIYAGDLTALLLSDEDLTDDQTEDREYARRFVAKLVESARNAEAEVPDLGPRGTPRDEFVTEVRSGVKPERFQVTSDEKERLAEEVTGIGKRDYLQDLLPVFGEVLESASSEDELRPLLVSYLSMTASLIQSGRIRAAADWLEEVRIVEQIARADHPFVSEILHQEIEKCLSREFFNSTGKAFRNALPGSPDDWISLFLPLQEHSGAVVIELLGQISQETLHSTFVDYLVTHVPGNTPLYLSALTHPEWMVVRDMVRVLKKLLGPSELTTAVMKVAAHPQPEVRLEVLRSLSTISRDAIHDLLRRAIRDSDPEVRGASIRLIAQSRDPFFAKPLAEIANLESFVERDSLEKRRWLVALGRCGGVSAIPFLEQVLDRSGSGEDELDLCIAALHGLAEIPDPRCRKLLETQANRLFGSRALKDTARQLLDRNRASTDGSPP